MRNLYSELEIRLHHPGCCHLHHDLSQELEGLAVREPVPQVGVDLEAGVEELVEVGADVLEVGFAGVLVYHGQVLQGQLVQVVDLRAVEEGRVLKDGLARHDAVATRVLQAAHAVLIGSHAAVGDDWDPQMLLDLPDDFPIGWAHVVLVVLAAPPMHDQHRAPSVLHDLGQRKGVSLVR